VLQHVRFDRVRTMTLLRLVSSGGRADTQDARHIFQVCQ
jgi:hypothetical protein